MNDRKPSAMSPAIWACAGLLALNLLLGPSGITSSAPALAAQSGGSGQPGTTMMPEPPFNAAEQRKRMIEALAQMSDRLARLEAKIDKGINVRVIEMPAAAKSD